MVRFCVSRPVLAHRGGGCAGPSVCPYWPTTITTDHNFAGASLNPNTSVITGVVCGVKVQEVEDPLMRKIRYLDKLVDELARGKPMNNVLRTA